ncbi:MAG: hypothetical protein DRN37_04130 [Thermoplasmata archaeon]|nr:MAG: hypothetical protein DRN37_04130 [Thermoplasmata archaeon]
MRTLALMVVPVCLFFLTSCSTLKSRSQSTGASESHSQAQAAPSEKPNSYYDFDDILIPKEMKLVPKSSLLFETPKLKAGVLFFEGRVNPVSLFEFFTSSMPNDGWELRSYFKYGRYILVFEKPDKDCIITINEKTLSTELELWVTPRLVK